MGFIVAKGGPIVVPPGSLIFPMESYPQGMLWAATAQRYFQTPAANETALMRLIRQVAALEAPAAEAPAAPVSGNGSAPEGGKRRRKGV